MGFHNRAFRNWHPLTWISHLVDRQLFGDNPGPQHIVNVLLHTANAILLLWLLFRLTGVLLASALVAGLFAWHPLHVESVAWIAERKDVLSTFFGLLTLLAYTRYAKEQSTGKDWDQDINKLRTGYVVALVCFGLGLLCKPMLVTLPFVFLLLDFWPLNRFSTVAGQSPGWRQLWYEKWPFFLLSAISCVVTFLVQQQGEAVRTLQQVSLSERLANVPLAYALYLLKTVWPAHLVVLYPLSQKISAPALVFSLLIVMLISFTVWLARQRSPYLIVGWLWFLGTLVPVIGLVQVGSQSMADRYTYFPLVGLFIAAAFGLRDLAIRFRVPAGIMVMAGILVLGGSIFLTGKQLAYWQNNESLFRHARDIAPNDPVINFWLGKGLQDEGKWDEALAEYRLSEQLSPAMSFGHYTIAQLLEQMGQSEGALAEYRLAEQAAPRASAIHDRMGMVLFGLGRYDEAINEFKNALQLTPGSSSPHFHIAMALARQGRDGAALAELHEALKIDPDNPQFLADTARLLSAAEDSQIRDGTAALAYALKANALTANSQPLVLDVLGMAYAETGQFSEAQQAVQKAIGLATPNESNQLESLRQRLELYQNQRPWRESFLLTNGSGFRP